jgi:hypothetical protein
MDKAKRIKEIKQIISDIDNGNIYNDWENHNPDFLLNLTAANIDAKVIRTLAAALVRAQSEIELTALNNHNPGIVEYLIELEARHIQGLIVTSVK